MNDKHLEIERRFLVKLPFSDKANEEISNSPHALITQTYIKTNDGTVERVRQISIKTWKQTFNHFYHTTKKFVSAGINEEDENTLDETQYKELQFKIETR